MDKTIVRFRHSCYFKNRCKDFNPNSYICNYSIDKDDCIKFRKFIKKLRKKGLIEKDE